MEGAEADKMSHSPGHLSKHREGREKEAGAEELNDVILFLFTGRDRLLQKLGQLSRVFGPGGP